jgi:hypothetical protein
MAYKNLPQVHIEIFTVGGCDTEIALCQDPLDIVTVLKKYRNSVIGPNTVCALFDVGNPTSSLECFHKDLGILSGKRIRGDGQKLDKHKAHRENDEECEQHQTQTLRHILEHIHRFFSSVLLFLANAKLRFTIENPRGSPS